MNFKFLQKLFLLILQLPIYILAFFIPKKEGIWIFSAWGGKSFSDNPKYLYRYVKSNLSLIRPIWIVKEKSLNTILNSNGVESYYFISFIGLYYQLRAEAAFFTHSQSGEFLGSAISAKTYLCQLWHGTPLKQIMLDDPSHAQYESRLTRKIALVLFPWLRNRWDMVVSPSKSVTKILQPAFAGSPVVVTGYPRNDSIVQGTIFALPQKIKKIIYMPTFRGENLTSDSDKEINKLLINTGFDIKKLDDFCNNRDLILVIRLHPSNKLNDYYISEIKKSNCIEIQEAKKDFYEEISQYDLLITDFSSVFFDFILTGKPIIHAGFDLEKYLKTSRSLYFSYENICLTPGISSWNQVLEKIDMFIKTGPDLIYVNKYQSLKRFSNDILSLPFSKNVSRFVLKDLKYREIKK